MCYTSKFKGDTNGDPYWESMQVLNDWRYKYRLQTTTVFKKIGYDGKELESVP